MTEEKRKNWPFRLVVVLLLGDLVLLGLGAALLKGYISGQKFGVSVDGGYAEWFEYAKTLFAAILFAVLYLRKRYIVFGVATLLFTYLLVDNAFQVHETVGGYLVEPLNLQPAFGLRAKDFGEVIVSGVVGCSILTLGVFGYILGNATARRVSIHLVIGCFALAFFGVVVDMVHMIVAKSLFWDKAFMLIEDGGEMLVFSAFAWYSALLLMKLKQEEGAIIKPANTEATPTVQLTFQPTALPDGSSAPG